MINAIRIKLVLKCLALCAVLSFANAEYSPVMELNIKGGNNRNIGRLGGLFPLYSGEDYIAYTSFFAMKDTKAGLEGNLGFGARKIINNDFIVGGYGFGDIRRSLDKKQSIYQFNIGTELLYEHFEARINGYFPVSDDVSLGHVSTRIFSDYNVSKNTSLNTRTHNERREILLKGYDVEVGGNIPNLEKLSSHIAFYHFLKGKISQPGFRVRAEYALKDWLSIGGEINYDTQRKWCNYADVKFQYHFDKEKRNGLTALQKKMTLLPVRDIDVVTRDKIVGDEYHRSLETGRTIHLGIGTLNGELELEGSNMVDLNHPDASERLEMLLSDATQNISVIGSDGKVQDLVANHMVNPLGQQALKEIVLNHGLYLGTSKMINPVLRTATQDINSHVSTDVLEKVRQKGTKLNEMFNDGISIEKLLSLKGVTPLVMSAEHVKSSDMRKGNITVKQMIAAHMNILDISNGGITSRQLMAEGGYSLAQLIDAGISRDRMIADGISPEEIDGVSGVERSVGRWISNTRINNMARSVGQTTNAISSVLGSGYSAFANSDMVRDFRAHPDVVNAMNIAGDSYSYIVENGGNFISNHSTIFTVIAGGVAIYYLYDPLVSAYDICSYVNNSSVGGFITGGISSVVGTVAGSLWGLATSPFRHAYAHPFIATANALWMGYNGVPTVRTQMGNLSTRASNFATAHPNVATGIGVVSAAATLGFSYWMW